MTAVWEKHDGPVLGGTLGTCFDICMLQEDRKFKMYFSWRPKKSVALVESEDGCSLGAAEDPVGANDDWVGRWHQPTLRDQAGRRVPHVVHRPIRRPFLDWLCDQQGRPILAPARETGSRTGSAMGEGSRHVPNGFVGCKSPPIPHVVLGGDQYEPDAIGYAVSPDGIHWKKNIGPVFDADPANRWEQHKVTACQVIRWQGWNYMFLHRISRH